VEKERGNAARAEQASSVGLSLDILFTTDKISTTADPDRSYIERVLKLIECSGVDMELLSCCHIPKGA
jgi:hypothetical protein